MGPLYNNYWALPFKKSKFEPGMFRHSRARIGHRAIFMKGIFSKALWALLLFVLWGVQGQDMSLQEEGSLHAYKQLTNTQTKYDFFRSKIKEFTDQGIPICWTLYLGMFPEKEGQQQAEGEET